MTPNVRSIIHNFVFVKLFYSFESKNKNKVAVKEVQLKVEEEKNAILPVCYTQYRKKLPSKVD